MSRPVTPSPGATHLLGQVVGGYSIKNIVRRAAFIDHELGQSWSHGDDQLYVQGHLGYRVGHTAVAGSAADAVQQNILQWHIGVAALAFVVGNVIRVIAVKFSHRRNLSDSGQAGSG